MNLRPLADRKISLLLERKYRIIQIAEVPIGLEDWGDTVSEPDFKHSLLLTTKQQKRIFFYI